MYMHTNEFWQWKNWGHTKGFDEQIIQNVVTFLLLFTICFKIVYLKSLVNLDFIK